MMPAYVAVAPREHHALDAAPVAFSGGFHLELVPRRHGRIITQAHRLRGGHYCVRAAQGVKMSMIGPNMKPQALAVVQELGRYMLWQAWPDREGTGHRERSAQRRKHKRERAQTSESSTPRATSTQHGRSRDQER